MKKNILIFEFAAVCSLVFSCSDELPNLDSKTNSQDLLFTKSDKSLSRTCELDSIIPLIGDSMAMRKPHAKTRSVSSSTSSYLYEELHQLDQIPIYLQIMGNTSTKQFLNVSGEGKELTFENYKDNDVSQQFYIKTLPSYTGIPYLLYSQKTKTLIGIGNYANNPDVKVVYAKPSSNASVFGASWDIRYGEYSNGSFIIENQDYPRQGNSGSSYDVYYSVITANDSKVSLEEYAKSPRQEFSIIPVESFRVESVTYDTKASTLSNTADVIFSDKFTNNGPIDQNHTFAISDSYRETSSFNKRTSYSVNVTTKFKVKVPFIANGEISTSVSEGQDFTYGETEEHSFSINRTYPITVPANYIAQMTLTLSKYMMDVEYCAVCVGVLSGRKINIRGIWKGVDVQESDAYLKLTPINGTKSEKRTIRITDGMISNSNGYIKVD